MKNILIVLVALAALVAGEEWYQQGHQAPLTWQNFDSSLSKPNTYKFVKFFTRNCRYCRMLKQVEEELRKQKEWSFQFYDIDCSLHYDLCMAKATITGFPYVGIYNGKGELAGKIGGYYPLQTLREAFVTIEDWQAAQKSNKTIGTEQPKQKPKEEVKQVQMKQTEEKVVKTEEKVNTEAKVEVKSKTSDQDNEGWSESVKDGIKMSIILAGVVLFNKIISPYLKQEQEQSSLKTHILQIPIHSTSTQQTVKASSATQTTYLMNDSL